MALNPPSKGYAPYTATIEPSTSQTVMALQERGVKVAMSVDTATAHSPFRARLVNFSDQPVLVRRNTCIGSVRPAAPEEIIELGQASAEMLEQRLLRVSALHHPDTTFKEASRMALEATQKEKDAGTYGAAAKAFAAAANAELTRTTQEPCTAEELREMLPDAGTLHDTKAPDGRTYAEHLYECVHGVLQRVYERPKEPHGNESHGV